MKQIIYFITIVALFLGNTVIAQQDPTYTMYYYNMNVINPAYAGTNDHSELNLNYRSQWVNLDGSPETKSMFFGTPVSDKVGLGLTIVNDEVFVLNQTDVYADFSYRLQVSDSINLYLGLKAGGTFIDIDLTSLGVMNDPVFSENVSRFNPNVGLGFYLKGKRFFVNLSAPTLLKSKRYEKDGVIVSQATDRLHVYSGAGYRFRLDKNFELIPSVLARFVTGAPSSLDITATARYSNIIDLGISYRVSESVSVLGLFKLLDWINLGYAYEMTSTDVRDYSDGSHELLLRFKF